MKNYFLPIFMVLVVPLMALVIVSCEPVVKKPIENFSEQEKAAILSITDSDQDGHLFNHSYYSDIEILSILEAPVEIVTHGYYGFGHYRVMVRDKKGIFATLAQDGLWNSSVVGDVIKKE